MQVRVDKGETTTITAYFKLCVDDPAGEGTMLYQDISKKFRYDTNTYEWVRYKKFIQSIRRMVHFSPQNIEHFYLQLMICRRKGLTSFEDLRAVNGILYSAYKDPALAVGLLESDNEWRWCMHIAAAFRMPYQLRLLFAAILVYSFPSDVRGLWNSSFDDMSRDFQRICNAEQDDRLVQYKTLFSVDAILRANGKPLKDFNSLPRHEYYSDEMNTEGSVSRMVQNERSAYDLDDLRHILEITQVYKMNANQQDIFDQVIQIVNEPKPGKKLIFIDGPGSAGKPFVSEHILVTIRAQDRVVLVVTSSGIAATLLMSKQTAHSLFKIPLQPTKYSTCLIAKETQLHELIARASLVIWDDAPMTHRFSFEADGQTLRDLMDIKHQPFGGKVAVLSRDFRQILPVAKHGGIADTFDARLKTSTLWPIFQQLHLTQNMWVLTAPNQAEGADLAAFSSLLLQVGDDRHKRSPPLDDEFMKLSQDLLICEPDEEPSDPATPYDAFNSDAEDQDEPEPEPRDDEDEDVVENQSDMVRLVWSVYFELNVHTETDAYFVERATLTPTNTKVHRINKEVTKRLEGEVKEYLSIDTVQEGTDEDGIPPHRLVLKVESLMMMIRNINNEFGLCNGMRLRVAEVRDNYIRATIMTGSRSGQHVFVPRIVFISNEGDFLFQLRRKQFSVVPSFAMTINKAQGQSLHHMGLYLPGPMFAHGQLYVALSRVTSRASIKLAVLHPVLKEEGGVYTKNVVYYQI